MQKMDIKNPNFLWLGRFCGLDETYRHSSAQASRLVFSKRKKPRL